MYDLYEELGSVIDSLEKRGLPYAVCGGLAMAVHGFTRATEDIDLFVPADAVDAVHEAVGDLGYVIRARPMNFSAGAMHIQRVSKIDPADGDVMTLDFLVVTPATEQVWATRERRVWRDRPVSVVSREGLVMLKRFRSSKQDLADIERLEGDE